MTDSNDGSNNDNGPKKGERPHRPVPKRRTRRRAVSGRNVGTRAYQTDIAAVKLDTTAEALRARIRRCARVENGQVVARLGMGVIARKFGCTWRVYIPEGDQADAT